MAIMGNTEDIVYLTADIYSIPLFSSYLVVLAGHIVMSDSQLDLVLFHCFINDWE